MKRNLVYRVLVVIWLGGVPGMFNVKASTNQLRRLEFREPPIRAYLVPVTERTNASTASRLMVSPGSAWTQALIEGKTNIVELGDRIVLQLEAEQSLESFLTGHRELTLSRTLGSDLFILQAKDSQAAMDAAEALARKTGVRACYPVMRRALKRRDTLASVPDDTRFSEQWNLENRDADENLTGIDLKVRAAWPVTRGEAVIVAIADDGVQLDHPELVNQTVTGPHYNFYLDRAGGNPASADANHATGVGGLIAAEQANGVGISGLAPQAQLASWVIFGASFHGQDTIASDEQLMDMFQYASNRVAVQNHSWGSAVNSQYPIDALSDLGIGNAVTYGRDGKGVILVRAGGNGREDLIDANDDGFANDPRSIAVAAARRDGRVCGYSSPGACLLVAAPSGDLIDTDDDGITDSEDPTAPNVLTTDRTGSDGYNISSGDEGNYVGFNGTSASSPQVAGVVALILSANPSLTYRDVQQILIHCARHVDLADPDVRRNGAGFRVSHNVGFGIPDSGFAVQLAKPWSNRPAATRLSFTNTARTNIPDDALRVVCAGSGLSSSLTSIRCMPSLGPHPDVATAALPLVYVGQANEDLTQDLHGQAALIQRGVSYFSDKITRAAQAGAAFAIIFNNTGATEIQAMGGTAFVPIPAVSIGKSDGEALRDFIAANPQTTARLQLSPAVYRFNVTNTLVCEHVGVRLKTTHTCRADVRITLVSPLGTRSVLQAINADDTAGPTDWTYWSVQHYFESSAGEWRLEVSDERDTTLRNFYGDVAATGAVTYAELILEGVALVDSDRDGLSDSWEQQWFGHLSGGPTDDPDLDGYPNAREQVLGTDPTVANAEFKFDLAELKPGYWRFSWPGLEGVSYALQSCPGLNLPMTDLGTILGRFPVTEYVIPTPTNRMDFYRVRSGN